MEAAAELVSAMQPIAADHEKPSRILDFSRLQTFTRGEMGGPILDGKSRLVQIPEIEDQEFLADLDGDMVTPNPRQPRKYFDPVKMAELKGTIAAEGQQAAVVVVPYLDEQGVVKLFIIDGERRWRTLKDLGKSHARVVVRWATDEEDIFKKALLLNESFATHNPVERAHAYKRLIGFKKAKGIPHAVETVAKDIGLTKETIYNHLKLLELLEKDSSGEIEKMVADGTLPPSNALIIASAKKKHGAKLDLIKLARALVDGLDDPTPEVDIIEPGKEHTQRGVREALRRVLIEGGSQDVALQLATHKAGYDLLSGIGRLRAGVKAVRSVELTVMIASLRTKAKGKPPELIRDALQALMAAVQRDIIPVLERAIAPDPLPEIPGKPPFARFLMSRNGSFNSHPLRQKLAMTLAAASDDKGRVLMVSELARGLQVSIVDIGNNMTSLERELTELGIVLEKHYVREKDASGIYEKRPAYRLAWKVEGAVAGGPAVGVAEPTPTAQPATPIAVAPIPVSARPQAPSSTPALPAPARQPSTLSPERRAALEASRQRIASRDKPPDSSGKGARTVERIAPPHLVTNAAQISAEIERLTRNVGIRPGTKFRNGLGMEIVVRKGGDGKITYIIMCNALGFGRNYRAYASIFGDMLPEGPKEVILRDVD